MTVLIVDDEAYMLEYMKNLVDWGSYGFDRVLTAAGGSLARDLLCQHKPELLITDIKMPKISGLELSALIDEEDYPTKVIIISGYGDFDYAKQALRYGVSEYLVKPVLREDFVESLERILEKHFELPAGGAAGKPDILQDKNDAVEYVKRYIWENFDQDLSLEALGAVVHLHPTYLSKIFKEVSDRNLSAYVTDVKMQKAAELLVQSDRKVQDIMNQLGYQKSQHFSKLFKERYGMTPNRYRLLNRRL